LSDFLKEQAVFTQIKSTYKDIENSIITKFKVFREEAQKVSQAFKIQHEGIVINGVIEGRIDELRSSLENLLDQRSTEAKTLINKVCDSIQIDTDSSEIIKEFINNIIGDKVQLRTNVTPEMAVSSILTRNWFTINYSASYDGDDFDGMSRGKQSFVILKLLLDFSKKTCPILIDQPEDSLDNRAIFTDLVEYLKKKKKERQIILVTHNANVVVGADSELIIVANQNGNNTPNSNGVKFQYLEGSLENTFTNNNVTKDTPVLDRYGIREHVCDIVEGGKEAFVKRENKYGF
jgi:predicted ATP-dependent endonuclease of OLD family